MYNTGAIDLKKRNTYIDRAFCSDAGKTEIDKN